MKSYEELSQRQRIVFDAIGKAAIANLKADVDAAMAALGAANAAIDTQKLSLTEFNEVMELCEATADKVIDTLSSEPQPTIEERARQYVSRLYANESTG